MAKTITVAVLLSLTAMLAGCAAQAPPADYRQYQPAAAGTVGPVPPSRDRLALEAAVALAADLKYDQAADRLAELIPRLHAAGDRTHAAEAMFWLGYCLEKQQRYDLAQHWYRRVGSTYPDTPAARQAARRLGRMGRRGPLKGR